MVPMRVGMPLTRQRPLLLATISERVQEEVLYPGSLTLMVLPLMPVARTQWPPLWTFRMTISLALRAPWMPLLATLPTQERPREFTDPQTKRSPLTQPPCPLSQVLRVEGLQFLPIPERAMATELIRHPALQMVLDEVPSCSLPHLESHCLQRGQVLHEARTRRAARRRILADMLLRNRLFINQHNIRFQRPPNLLTTAFQKGFISIRMFIQDNELLRIIRQYKSSVIGRSKNILFFAII